MELYFVMVTLNCLHYTQMTLGSIKTDIPHNFIIVDNASTDGTFALLDELSKFPNQIHIRNKVRVSVAQAWNMGLKRCMQDPEFKYAYVINNDILFEEKCVDVLVKFVKEHPEYVIVSGFNRAPQLPSANRIIDDVCDFAAYLITRTCIEKIGYFDEGFEGAYFEDNDYHTRVYRAGLKSCMILDASFNHFKSRTLHEGMTAFEQGTQQAFFERNRAYFKRKWGFVPA